MATIVQVTYSGKDAGGYVWQNVVHLQCADPTVSIATYLSNIADQIDAAVTAALVACKASTNVVLDLATKVLLATPSFTFHKPIVTPGTRMGVEAIGAIGGKLIIYPSDGNQVGHQYVNGVIETDFSEDLAGPTLIGFLNDLADAWATIDGSVAPEQATLGVFHKKTGAFSTMTDVDSSSSPSILSKRVRN